MDRRTSLELRVDGKNSLHEFQPLLHAVETKPAALPCRFKVEACALFADREMNLIRCSLQLHIELPDPAVFHRIVQGFLKYTKEAKGNVRRYEAR